MFWKKNKPKSPDEDNFDVLEKKIFPGGTQEKLFRTQKVVEICNGKLLPQEALLVYTKAKVRFTIASVNYDGETHRGRTADDLIQRTIEDSGGKLGFLESVSVNAYAVFDKVDPVVNSYESLKIMLLSAFGSDTQGYDCDVIPFAVGEFGLEVTNPIPIRGIGGIQIYFRRLRRENGENVVCKRARGIKEANTLPVDEYDIFSQAGHFLTKLYVSPYHQRISKKAPKGFKLV